MFIQKGKSARVLRVVFFTILSVFIYNIGIPSTVFAEVVATTSFETTNGTTTPTDGNVINGTGDGVGWSGNWSAGSFNTDTQYDNSQSYAGSWSLLQDTGSTNDEPDIQRTFAAPLTSGKVTLAMRKNKTDRNDVGFLLTNGGTGGSNRAAMLLFVPSDARNGTAGSGDVVVYDSTTETVIADNFQASSTWYKIEIDFDCALDTYNVYVDGIKQNSSPLDFYAPQTQIDRIWVVTGASQSPGAGDTAGSQFWMDDIRVVQ